MLHLVSEKLPHGIDMHFRIDGKLFKLWQLKAKTLTTHMTVLELQYADDNGLVTHTEKDLQADVDALSYACKALGLTLMTRTHKFFGSVDHLTYLSSCLSSKADVDVEN